MGQEETTRLVSVVVCARNRSELIADTLRSVLANKPGEVIVIDDQSTDGTADVARKFTDRVIRSEGKGLAAARQLGAERASGRYVAYVDSDVILSEGSLAQMVAVLEEDSSYAAVRAIVLVTPANKSYWAGAAREVKDLARGRGPLPGETTGVGCAAVAIRRELILKFRFDPFFVGAAEDADFFGRLLGAGWRLYRCPSIAYHHGYDSFSTLVKQQIWYGRGAARLEMKKAQSCETGGNVHRRGSGRQPSPSLRPILRKGRLDLLPFYVASGVAFRIGLLLERLSLRRTGIRPA